MHNPPIRSPQDPSQIAHIGAALEAIRSDRTRLPLMVEFCGLPKAGKSTVLGKVKRSLDRLGFRTGVVAEAATTKFESSLRGDLRYFNLLTALENLSQTLSHSRRRQDFDVVLLDRGPFDSLVWFDQLARLGLLTPKNHKDLEEMVRFPAWFANVRVVVFIDNDFDTYKRRFLMDCTLADEPKMAAQHFELLRDSYADQLAETRLAKYKPGFFWYKTKSSVTNALTASDAQMQMAFWNFAHDNAYVITSHLVRFICDRATESVAVVPSITVAQSIVAPMTPETMATFVDSVFGGVTSDSPVPKTVAADKGQYVSYLPRPVAEATSTMTQLVAAAFIRHPDGGFYVFKRSKNERRPELASRLTLVVGGHVDDEDRYLGDGGRNAVENCLFRELREEVSNLDLPVLQPRFGIRIGSSEMGKRHLALVYEVHTYSRRVTPIGIPGAGDFDRDVQTMSLNDLVSAQAGFDDWSQAIIRQLELASNAS